MAPPILEDPSKYCVNASFLLLVAMPLVTSSDALATSSFLNAQLFNCTNSSMSSPSLSVLPLRFDELGVRLSGCMA